VTWQRYREGATVFTACAGNANMPPMRLDQCAHNCQSQSDAAAIAIARTIGAIETVKDKG